MLAITERQNVAKINQTGKGRVSQHCVVLLYPSSFSFLQPIPLGRHKIFTEMYTTTGTNLSLADNDARVNPHQKTEEDSKLENTHALDG